MLRLVELTAAAAEEVAGWFVGDAEGRRRFGGFYGVHPKWWDLVREDPCRHGWVATAGARAVGFLDVETAVDGSAQLAFYVRPEWRRQGFGVALLEAAVREARRLGATTLSAAVEPDNAASLACCWQAGFVDAGTNEHGDVVLVRRTTPGAGGPGRRG